jgi:predicted negative regulator of RcsB-dependent stress response
MTLKEAVVTYIETLITAFAWQNWEKSQETQTEMAVLRIQSIYSPNAKQGRTLSL